MTQLGLTKLHELGVEKIFDLRSPIEFQGQHSVHGAKHQSSQAKDTSEKIYPDRINNVGIRRVTVPVFVDEQWHQDRRDSRLRQYASAAEVTT
jgi:hypothetical protein